jgi:phosphotransferase system HPr (HPr) family protein
LSAGGGEVAGGERGEVALSVRVPNAAGLHARPCHAIASLAARFQGELCVACDGHEADGKSVLSLMTLCAPCESTLHLRARGPDARALAEAVAALVAGGFGESA